MRAILVGALALGLPLGAQWLKYPTPGIPRTAHGKPDLTAPAPKTADGKPDLSGIWKLDALGYAGNITSDLRPGEIMPWAMAVYEDRVNHLASGSPMSHCLPAGPEIGMFGELQKVIQTPELVAILNEWGIFRQIFTDGRKLPEDPTPAWQGYSIGHWDGDTLVVETAGFNDKSWLDFSGHTHTEALRITERYRRTNFGHMQLQITYDDPKTFTRAFSIAMDVNLAPDTELLEFVCNENERDEKHLVGKLTDERTSELKVPAATLAKYVGTYHMQGSRALAFGITLTDGGALTLSMNGQGATELVPKSQTSFYYPGLGSQIEFVTDSQGKVTHLILINAEGEYKAVRK